MKTNDSRSARTDGTRFLFSHLCKGVSKVAKNIDSNTGTRKDAAECMPANITAALARIKNGLKSEGVCMNTLLSGGRIENVTYYKSGFYIL